jgi:hypothetical protein
MFLAGVWLVACEAVSDPRTGTDSHTGRDAGLPSTEGASGSASLAKSGDTVVALPGRDMGPVRLRLSDGKRPEGGVLLVATKGAAVTPTRATLDSSGTLLIEAWTPVLASALCDSLLVSSEDSAAAVVGTLHACQEVDLELNPQVVLMAPGGQRALNALVSSLAGDVSGGHDALSGSTVRISWQSIDPGVASVNAAGQISANAPGSTRIKAAAGATRRYVTVSVMDPDQPPGQPLVARVTAGPEETFVSWVSPTSTPTMAVVWGRPLGALTWSRYDVPGGQTWRTLPGEVPGTQLEVMVAMGDPATGQIIASRHDTTTVLDVAACRALAGRRIADSRVFCTGAALLGWVTSNGLSADDVHCRGLSLAAASGDLPNCVWEAGAERLLLLRGLDERFQARVQSAPADVPAAYRRLLFGAATPQATIWRPDPAIGTPLAEARVGLVQGYRSAVSWNTNQNAVGVITWFEPQTPNGAIAIYHEGHGGEATEIGAETISWLLARGWSVVSLNMPRLSHMRFRDLYAGEGNAVWRMLYGIGQVTEWIHRSWAPGRDPVVVAIGRSGGGWSTLLYGALDPRIDATVVASGFEPLTQRLMADAADIGDWEQTAPSLFGVLDYTDVVRLASSRPLLVTYNEWDGCCFRKTVDDPFVQWLRDLPQDGVSLTTAVVSENLAHGLSPEGYAALGTLLDDLLE